MITDQNLIDLLNQQIRNELEAHKQYLAMSAWFETTPYRGFAAKYRKAAMEEHTHAMKFYDYLADRDGRIKILATSEPATEFDSVAHAARVALEQEQRVSAQIRSIYAAANACGDFETVSFLQWFLNEQVEEERVATDFLGYAELADGNAVALLDLDAHAAAESGQPDPHAP